MTRYLRATFWIALWLIFDGQRIGLHRTKREFLRAVWESYVGEAR